MQRNREHAGVVPEDTLRSVPVVRIDVDIRHPADAAVEQLLHGKCSVVIDTKAAGPLARGVVHAAAEVDGAQG
ncbi:hypothetical protein D3C85_1917450 [compost metagenome]